AAMATTAIIAKAAPTLRQVEVMVFPTPAQRIAWYTTATRATTATTMMIKARRASKVNVAGVENRRSPTASVPNACRKNQSSITVKTSVMAPVVASRKSPDRSRETDVPDPTVEALVKANKGVNSGTTMMSTAPTNPKMAARLTWDSAFRSASPKGGGPPPGAGWADARGGWGAWGGGGGKVSGGGVPGGAGGGGMPP